MKREESLNSILMEELSDLLDAENQLVKVLPRISKATRSSALKAALEDHFYLTRGQADRLQDIFSNIGQHSQWMVSKTMKKLINEGQELIDHKQEGQDRDARIIDLMKRMDQYQISACQTSSEHAADLGHSRIVELLNKTLEEERTMNFQFNELAQGMINAQAIGRFISEGNPNTDDDGAD